MLRAHTSNFLVSDCTDNQGSNFGDSHLSMNEVSVQFSFLDTKFTAVRLPTPGTPLMISISGAYTRG